MGDASFHSIVLTFAGAVHRCAIRLLTPYIVFVLTIRQQVSLEFLLHYCSVSQKRSFYRQDAAKRQTAGIKFTHRPKISIFAPRGRLVAPIHVKFGTTKGHMGALGYTKLHANRFTEVGTRQPKWQNFSLFGNKSPRRGEPFDRFLQSLRAFIRSTILH